MTPALAPVRTYNQNHVARPYGAGRRRISIYWTWSYPWEANRDLTELDNRFSTMTEVRRVGWPNFEATEWDKMNFLQGMTPETKGLFFTGFHSKAGTASSALSPDMAT